VAAASLQHVLLELGHVVAGKLLRRRTRVIGRLLGIARMRLVPAVLDIVVASAAEMLGDLGPLVVELCADGTMYVPSTADGGCQIDELSQKKGSSVRRL